MIYLKVNNFFNLFDQPDYKGLELSKIVAGSQLYPFNEDNSAYFATTEENLPIHVDIVEITEQEYLTKRQEFKDAQQSEIQTTDQKITELEESQLDLWDLILFGGV